ncbi:MAG: NAD(P)H-dependent oxidoreductase [Alphaproteobacteria bacterium]|nr:NAD(P)H-dependent oxidoreductase [Alphaproteobacteria bacterium SS10]
MASLLVYYAHPGHQSSRVNRPMAEAAAAVEGITFIDLYHAYPRHHIDVSLEQERLLAADVVLFQFPLFWYSTPSLVKEWIDLVLEHGFAYGSGGDRLAGKTMMLALTAAGPEDAYTPDGYQNFPLRTFLTPLEQTARLCQMRFTAPYVLHASLKAPVDGEVAPHVAGYERLLTAIRDDNYDFDAADALQSVTYATLPIRGTK